MDRLPEYPLAQVGTGADMSGQWLTVAEAVTYSASRGLPRTAKTVRRWAARAIQFPEDQAEVKVQRQDTENGFRWLINRNSLDVKIDQEKDFELRARTPSTSENMSGQVGTGADMSGHVRVEEATLDEVSTRENMSAQVGTGADRRDDSMLEFLKKQIEVKDQQIAVKDQQIVSMLERDRETNILIQGLQTNLARVAEALPSGRRDEWDRHHTGKSETKKSDSPEATQANA